MTEDERRPGRAAAAQMVTNTNAHQRNRLALSIVAHATPATAMKACDRATLALQGATISEILRLTAVAA